MFARLLETLSGLIGKFLNDILDEFQTVTFGTYSVLTLTNLVDLWETLYMNIMTIPKFGAMKN